MPALPTPNDVLGSFANYNAITGPPLPGSQGYNQPKPTPPAPGLPQQIIPDAGVYGAGTNAANAAYNNAVTNALAQRNALYNQYGLLNNGQVDPNNPYGQYEQMLDSEAGQLTADQQNAAGRNLGRGGLANQQISTDRNAQAAQNYAFQQNVAGNETNYQQALQGALSTKNASIDQAYQDALNTSLQNMILNMQMGNYGGNGESDPSTYNDSQLAALGAAGAGASPFSDADTTALAAKFGQMTASQLNNLGVRDSMGNLLTTQQTKTPAKRYTTSGGVKKAV
jgi:hypothetical protein